MQCNGQVTHQAGNKTGKYMADILKLYPKIKKWEGGFVNDPADLGGATNKGVTLNTYRKYCKIKKLPSPSINDLRQITDETVIEILREFYWNPCKADDILNQSIANLIVNSVWGSGLGYIKKVQEVAGVKADGVIGPKTIAAINNADQETLFNKLWQRRKKWFEDVVASSVKNYERKIGRAATEAEKMKHTNKRFLKGWLNRLNDFTFEPTPTSPSKPTTILMQAEFIPINSTILKNQIRLPLES